MTTLTIQAADTASAMEEIAERLGEDALILSTSKKDGKVIMRATNGADLPAPATPSRPSEDFNQMYNAGLSGSLPGKPRLSPEPKARPAAATAATSAAQAELPDTAQRAMMQAMGLMADRIDQLDRKLAGMMLTGPAGLNADLQESTPLQLSRAGYSQKTILRLQPSYAGLGYETGVSSFLDCLAEDLTDLKSESLLQKRVIFVVGATGSGRTTLASKLAASLKDAHPGKEVALASLSATLNETDTKLRSYARLLNIPVSQLTQDVPDQHFDKMTDFDMMVVDVTLHADEAVERVSRLKQHLGEQNAAVVMSLSGGSSAKMISLTVAQFAALAPTIGLTKLDECETTSTEFSALAEAGARISLLSGTKSVVGAIAFASAKILAQYLKENFQADTSDNLVV
ncbi:flagellar GTP-binding protein [SAR116 cluster alpha proteobacterium HIMB100]|nr:flagellar GTP-binding protein [SAR116 cluster alpha proteobacterium HIMB100]